MKYFVDVTFINTTDDCDVKGPGIGFGFISLGVGYLET